MNKGLRMIYGLILLFYLFLLFDTVFFSRDSLRSVNFIPYHSIKQYIMVDNGIGGYRLVDMNIWGNVLMFIPLGIYMLVHGKSLSLTKCVLWITGSSVLIEMIQFIFAKGAADIDDVILNSLGGVIGIGVYMIFAKIFKTDEKIKTAIAILAMIVGIPMIVLVTILVVVNFS